MTSPESFTTQFNQPTVTNNAMSGTMISSTTNITASDQQLLLGIQLQQLQTQHLANLLLKAALQLYTTLPTPNTAA